MVLYDGQLCRNGTLTSIIFNKYFDHISSQVFEVAQLVYCTMYVVNLHGTKTVRNEYFSLSICTEFTNKLSI